MRGPRFVGRVDAIQWREYWVLDGELSYYSSLLPKGVVTVPAAFATDWASIPKPLHWLYEPSDSRWSGAALVHDLLYERQTVPQRVADAVLYEAMGVLQPTGMLPASKLTRAMFWLGVRAFGAGAYETAPMRQEERRLMAAALGRL